jgi:hypothetical protein
VAPHDKAETNPNAKRHDAMMKKMQKCDLIVLFTQNEKDSVEKINKLGDVKAIANCNQLDSILVGGIIDRLTNETVAVKPRQTAGLVENIAIEKDLEYVVDHKCTSQFKCCPICHELWPQHFDPEEVSHRNQHCCKRKFRKEPAIRSSVYFQNYGINKFH